MKPGEAVNAVNTLPVSCFEFLFFTRQGREGKTGLLNVFKTHPDISGLNIEHISHINISG